MSGITWTMHHELIKIIPVEFFNIVWHPLPDITAWELAQVLPILFAIQNVREADFEQLPVGVRRHFEVGG